MNILISTIYAQGGLLDPGGVNAPTSLTVEALITFAVTAVIVVAGIIFLIMLLLGGLRWIVSGGDKAATESARGQVTSALIGLVIVFSAWAITELLSRVFGINILSFTVPTALEGGAALPAGN